MDVNTNSDSELKKEKDCDVSGDIPFNVNLNINRDSKVKVDEEYVVGSAIPTSSAKGNMQQDSGDISKEECPEKEQSTEEALPPVGFFSLFRYSSAWDKLLICVATIVSICSGGLWPAFMIVFGEFVDTFVNHAAAKNNATNSSEGNSSLPDTEAFLEKMAELTIYNSIFGALIFIFNYIFVCSFSLTAATQAYKIRCLFMASILKQDIAWFDTHQTGDFASRLTGDLTKIQDGIAEKVGICINYMATGVFCLACGIYYGWKLALVILSVTPVLTVAMGILSKIQASVTAQELETYGAAAAVAEEVLSSIRTVVAFGGEKKEIKRYERCLLPARKKGIKKGLMTSIGSALTWFCIFAGYALAFWYGVKLIVEEKDEENPTYTAGTLIIIFSCVMTASMFIGQTAPFFEAFAIARGAAAKVFSIIERLPFIDSSSESGETPFAMEGNIKLNNVSFNYPSRPDVPVLTDISLEVKPGETVALVGPSGCGKSTIIQLILRFYDILEGDIEIDHNNIKDLNVGWLRNNIGLVGQEPVLFSTTIAENIRLGKVDATMEEIQEAAEFANAHDFIDSLPLKYDTLVGEHGTQLSGGQKQRVAIARAIIKNPKILLLDEATSALDTESEAVVQSALDKARKGRTTIIVAHRLSTVRNADRIFVLSDGVIKEIGSHDQLMKLMGTYYKLVISQMKESTDDEGILEEDLSILDHPQSILRTMSHKSDENLPTHFQRQISVASSGKDADVTVRYDFKDEESEGTVSPSQLRLLQAASPEWPYLLVGGLCAIMMGAFTPVYGIIFGAILGVLSEPPERIYEDNLYYCKIFMLLAVGASTASFLQVFMFSIAGEKLTSRLRKMVFTKLVTQDISWFDHPDNSVGALCSKLTSDASDVQGATGSRLSTLLQAFATLVASIVIGMWFNYKIGLVVLAFVPLVLISIYFEGRAAAGQIFSEKSGTEEGSKVAIEAIENIRTVASLHQEETFYNKFRIALLLPYTLSKRKSHIRGLAVGFGQSLQVLAYSTAFYYGSHLIASGELTYDNLFKVLEGVIVGSAMVGQAVAFAPDYQKAKIAAVRIFRLLDLKADINVFSEDGHMFKNVNGNITFDKVHFNYPSRPKVKVLRGLDFQINPGQTVALVGSSGCGKSTCIQLIERFYDAHSGKVALDEVDVKDMNVNNLRSHIGLVSQEPVLFSYSIAENIAYGDHTKKMDMNDIIAAARQANIHEFVSSLPQGYDTPVGSKGTQLSGGQKQRVAIARSLLRNPKILLLDEATSALDAESERIVQEALDKARSGRTCLIIAHRLSTIQNADLILVIHQGKIVEKGTHQELMRKKGHYYNLHNTQTE